MPPEATRDSVLIDDVYYIKLGAAYSDFDLGCSSMPGNAGNFIMHDADDTTIVRMQLQCPEYNAGNTCKWFYPSGKPKKSIQSLHDGTSLITEWHDSGHMQKKYFLKRCPNSYNHLYHDCQDGLSEEWFENGSRSLTEMYHDGKKHGPWAEYYESGEKKIEGHYVNGKKDSIEKWYYKNGALLQQFQYKNGERHGYWSRWDYAGNKCLEGTYDNGKPAAPWNQCHTYRNDAEIQSTLIGGSFEDILPNNFYGGLAAIRKEGMVGFINREGKLVIPMIYNSGLTRSFSSGKTHVIVNDVGAIMDSLGNYLSGFECPITRTYYNEVYFDHSSHNPKEAEEKVNKKNRPGFEDYHWYSQIGDHRFVFMLEPGGQLFLADEKGTEIPTELMIRNTRGHNQPLVCKVGDQYELINQDGKRITKYSYNKIRSFYSNRAFARRDGKWALIDLECNEILPPTFDMADPDEKNKNGCWSECWYSFSSFGTSYAEVRLNDKWGLIDTSGQVVIPYMYDDLDDNFLELFHAKKDGKWGMIDHKGKAIMPFIFDRLAQGEGDFNASFVKVTIGDEHGVYTTDGKKVIMSTDTALTYSFSFDRVYLRKEGKMGALDATGKELFPLEYDYISPLSYSDRTYYTRKGAKYTYYDEKSGCFLWCE